MPSTFRAPLVRFGAVFAALLAASLLWAFGSPLSSVPDEPSHAIKAAAVVRGQLTGEFAPGNPGLEVQVPQWVADAHLMTCYAFQPDVTPGCQADGLGISNELVTSSTTAGKYNPLYYALVGWPSLLFADQGGFYAMRIVSAILSCLFLAGAIAPLLAGARTRFTAAATLVTVTPMVLFLTGSLNPNALEVATVACLIVHLVAALRVPATQRMPLSHVVWVAVAGSLLANTRAASLMWLLVAAVVAVLLVGWRAVPTLIRRPSVLVGIAAIGIATAASLAWTLGVGALESKPFEGAGMSVAAGLLVMLERTFDYTLGVVGYFGWVDTPAPSIVLLLWGAVVAVLVAIALAIGRGRTRIAVVVAAGAYVLVPAISQALAVPEIGFIWQGRYNLALFVILMFAAGTAIDAVPLSWSPLTVRFVRIGIVLLSGAQAYAWLWAMRRYVSGLGLAHPWTNMIRDPGWQPPLGWITWFALTLLVFGVIAWRLWAWAGSRLPDTVERREVPAR